MFLVVHVSKLNRIMKSPDRPNGRLMVDNGDRVNFNKPIVAENCWEIDLDADECEVRGVLDVRSGR